MPVSLVTGSSRGIGLQLVSELLQNKDNIVFATARAATESSGLRKLKHDYLNRLSLIHLDVTNEKSIKVNFF